MDRGGCPWQAQSMRSQESDMTEQLTHTQWVNNTELRGDRKYAKRRRRPPQPADRLQCERHAH